MSLIDLRHGIFLPPFHPNEEDPTQCLERDLELMVWLDRLGFHEAWIGEHHSAGSRSSRPEIFIAFAAERTRHIRFGTGVISLPYHHPMMVADRIVQLDHMTRGRIMFGAGPGLLAVGRDHDGHRPDDPARPHGRGAGRDPAPVPGRDRHREDRLVHDGGRRLHLLPYTRPYPEVAVVSAVTPSGGRLAGKYDLGMICVAATNPFGFDALGSNWQIACDIAAENGRTMDPNGCAWSGRCTSPRRATRLMTTPARGSSAISATSTTTSRALSCRRARTRSNGLSRAATACAARPTTRSR